MQVSAVEGILMLSETELPPGGRLRTLISWLARVPPPVHQAPAAAPATVTAVPGEGAGGARLWRRECGADAEGPGPGGAHSWRHTCWVPGAPLRAGLQGAGRLAGPSPVRPTTVPARRIPALLVSLSTGERLSLSPLARLVSRVLVPSHSGSSLNTALGSPQLSRPPNTRGRLTRTFPQLRARPPHLDPLPDARRHVPEPLAPGDRQSRSPSETALREASRSWRPSGCLLYAAAGDAANATERYPRYLRRPGRRLGAPILKNSRRSPNEPDWR